MLFLDGGRSTVLMGLSVFAGSTLDCRDSGAAPEGSFSIDIAMLGLWQGSKEHAQSTCHACGASSRLHEKSGGYPEGMGILRRLWKSVLMWLRI